MLSNIEFAANKLNFSTKYTLFYFLQCDIVVECMILLEYMLHLNSGTLFTIIFTYTCNFYSFTYYVWHVTIFVFLVSSSGRRELSRTFCGSTAYAAPEVLQGIPYNPMMYDVWSLGCVLFIMMTGTMPFDDSNVRNMVTCQLKRQIRYPSTFRVNKEVKVSGNLFSFPWNYPWVQFRKKIHLYIYLSSLISMVKWTSLEIHVLYK